MLFIISVGISVVASAMGFRWAKNFMNRRLRYVDAAQSWSAPLIAGVAAGLLALPFTWLPLIGLVTGLGTAVALGLGVGLGVASAKRDIRLALYR